MCSKTGGEKLTRAASQENVLGDIISFCAGSVRLGAGDGKASSRCLSFVTHGAVVVAGACVLVIVFISSVSPISIWPTPQQSDLELRCCAALLVATNLPFSSFGHFHWLRGCRSCCAELELSVLELGALEQYWELERQPTL